MTIREKAMERLNRPTSQWTIEAAQNAIKCAQTAVDYYNTLPIWKQNAHDNQIQLANQLTEIEVLKAIIKILTEQAEAEIASEAIQTVASLAMHFPKTTVMRKVVAKVANKLHKLGISLSECFTRAWVLIKGVMRFIYHNSGKQAA